MRGPIRSAHLTRAELAGRGRDLARVILTRAARRLDRRHQPWGAAMLAELEHAATAREALAWALGGLRVIWLQRASGRHTQWPEAAVRRRLRGPRVLATLSAVSAVVTMVFRVPVPAAAFAGSSPTDRLGPAHGDGMLAAGFAFLPLLLALLAFLATIAIASNRIRLAKRLLEVTAVLGGFTAVWVGPLAVAARAWLAVAARPPAGDTGQHSQAG
jgi:hypothetical protein